jgi:hypothetical protein
MSSTIPRLVEFFSNKAVPLGLVAAMVFVSFFLSQDELRTFLIVAVLSPIFIYYKYDGRIIIGYAVFLLAVTGVLTLLNEEDYAERLAVLGYWLLVVGTSCLLIELYRKNPKSSNRLYE